MNDWVMDVETMIYSLVKTKTYSELVEKYPNINYTTEETAITDTKFPNVYIHLKGMAEIGNDLENESINAVLATVQIDVTTNAKKSDARTVIGKVMNALKESRFTISSSPIFTKDNDVHRAILTANRAIGNGDVL